MTGLSASEVADMRDRLAALDVQMEARKFHDRSLVLFGDVHPSAVPPAKRRAAEDLLTKLARTFRSCPSLAWFSRLTDAECQAVADDAYPFKAYQDEAGTVGFCSGDRKTVALSIELDSPRLEQVLAHEFAHHLGVDDEAEADQFAENCLGS